MAREYVEIAIYFRGMEFCHGGLLATGSPPGMELEISMQKK